MSHENPTPAILPAAIPRTDSKRYSFGALAHRIADWAIAYPQWFVGLVLGTLATLAITTLVFLAVVGPDVVRRALDASLAKPVQSVGTSVDRVGDALDELSSAVRNLDARLKRLEDERKGE
jgi:hypothetical protein